MCRGFPPLENASDTVTALIHNIYYKKVLKLVAESIVEFLKEGFSRGEDPWLTMGVGLSEAVMEYVRESDWYKHYGAHKDREWRAIVDFLFGRKYTVKQVLWTVLSQHLSAWNWSKGEFSFERFRDNYFTNEKKLVDNIAAVRYDDSLVRSHLNAINFEIFMHAALDLGIEIQLPKEF